MEVTIPTSSEKHADTYLGLCQKLMMEDFAKIFNGYLTISRKTSIIDV